MLMKKNLKNNIKESRNNCTLSEPKIYNNEITKDKINNIFEFKRWSFYHSKNKIF